MLVLVALLTVLTIYVIAAAGTRISAARKLLAGSITNLDAADIGRAQAHLQAAHNVLRGFAADILRVVPVERQNVGAVRQAVDGTIPVLAEARALRERLDQLERGRLVAGGRISLAQIRGLQAPLESAASSVASLVSTLKSERSGWLIPTIWDGMSNTLSKAEELQTATSTGTDIVNLAPELLGTSGTRRYLVLLVNNAEVRPSGGIVSGIGLLKIHHGHITLGSFHYYTDLAKKPYRTVSAPPDFERRYGRFNANTTRWVNVTMSPDTEEVARVAAKLYRLTAGKTTDGAFVVDPRGVAALLPNHTRVHVPGTHKHIDSRNLTRYVYSKAYRQLGGHTTVRHDALIAIGRAAFQRVAGSGFGGQARVTAAAQALAGGHLRVISFHAAEEKVLAAAGVTGRLRGQEGDRLFVTSTNFNGTKLDFWSHQAIHHVCDVRSEGQTRCETTVAITNSAPQGLSRYVAGAQPYGELRSLLEVYLPADVTLQRVLLDGKSATFSEQPEHGLKAIGIEVRVLPGATGRLLIDYALPARAGGYSLEITPQPLSHDAELGVTLHVPQGWKVAGGTARGRVRGDVYEQTGRLSHPQSIAVRPLAVRGISSWWQSFDNFWHDQIF